MKQIEIELTKLSLNYLDNVPCQICVFIAGILSITLYVIETYEELDAIPRSFSFQITQIVLEILFFLVFAFDYAMLILAASRRLEYVLSFMGIADLLSLLPIIDLIYAQFGLESIALPWIGFFRFFRLLTLFHVLKLKMSMGYNSQPFDTAVAFQIGEISYQVARLVVSIAVFIFIGSGVVFSISANDPSAYDQLGSHEISLTWFESLYFVIVTVTTVGYGDILPRSILARVATICMIIIGFGVIPAQATALFQAIISRPKYMDSLILPSNSFHICICGIVDYELLSRVLTELYHPANTPAAVGRNLIVAILSPTKPTYQVRLLLTLTQFKRRVFFFIGSAKSTADLARIQAENCLAVYVLPDVVTVSLRVEEDSVFLSTISITKYLHRSLQSKRLQKVQSVQHGRGGFTYGGNKPAASSRRASALLGIQRDPRLPATRTLVKLTSSARGRQVLLRAGVDIALPLQEFKYGVLGCGIAFPGFISLFITLTRARSTLPWTQQRQQLLHDRLPECYEALRYSLHQINCLQAPIDCNMRGMTISAATLLIYKRSRGHVYLLGAIADGRVQINPGKVLTVNDCDALFMIAPSWQDAHNQVYLHPTDDTVAAAAAAVMTEEGKHSERNADQIGCYYPAKLQLRRSGSAMGSYEREPVDRTESKRYQEQPSFLGEEPIIASRRLDSFTFLGPITATSGYSFCFSPKRMKAIREGSDNAAASLRQCQMDDMGLSKAEDKPKSGHVLIILSFSGSPAELSSYSLMSPLVFLLKALRATSPDDILILSERADELALLRDEIDRSNAGLLNNVQFVQGIPRNPDHLRMCNVQTARVVAIIRPPLAAETAEEGEEKDASRAAILNADRHTIITSLNLHLILQDYRSGTGGTTKTFTVSEIIHESNIAFLRQWRHTPPQSDSPSKSSRDVGPSDEGAEYDYSFYESTIFDWPLLAAGSILNHTAMDSLMAQAVFNPDILSFWEAVMGVGTKGVLSQGWGAQKSSENVCDTFNHSEPFGPIEPSKEGLADLQLAPESLDAKDGARRLPNINVIPTFAPLSLESPLDKVEVPLYLVGHKFHELFEEFLTKAHAIAVGLYRLPAAAEDQQLLPFVVTAPSHETILVSTDEIFILKHNNA